MDITFMQNVILLLLKLIDTDFLSQVEFRDNNGLSLYPTPEDFERIPRIFRFNEFGIGTLPKRRLTSLFRWDHLLEATTAANTLSYIPTFEEFVKTSIVMRSFLNEEVYVFAVVSAVMNRRDTQKLQVPSLEEIMPHWFFASTVITRAERAVKSLDNDWEPVVVDNEFAGSPLDREFALAYFREDALLNSNHWHWHMIYPYTWNPEDGGVKDRKGELFFYMHRQILARYNAERLSNYLPKVRSLGNFREQIPEGYSPGLRSILTGIIYPPRPSNLFPHDTNNITMDRLSLWETRILNAIHFGMATEKDGRQINLRNVKGIDIVGAMIEAGAISPNMNFYGDYHNSGHRLISRIHDPDELLGGERGVMGFPQTAMRDPVFYPWHQHLDNLFEEHKRTLPPYEVDELSWLDVSILSVSMIGHIHGRLNSLQTFWNERRVTISNGINFGRPNHVMINVRHLEYERYTLAVDIDNMAASMNQAVIRLFIAPKFNEFQEQLNICEQQRLFIELDKFVVLLKPGFQTIYRHSANSSVAMHPSPSFRKLYNISKSKSEKLHSHVGCGWPEYMLLPKGRIEGMAFTLFVMATDWTRDTVDLVSHKAPGSSYCGHRNRRYPDQRPMGFPFDRPIAKNENFLLANMYSVDIVINHVDKVLNVKL